MSIHPFFFLEHAKSGFLVSMDTTRELIDLSGESCDISECLLYEPFAQMLGLQLVPSNSQQEVPFVRNPTWYYVLFQELIPHSFQKIVFSGNHAKTHGNSWVFEKNDA